MKQHGHISQWLRQELKSCRKDSQIFPPDPHAGIPICALGDSYLCRSLGFWVPGYIDLLGLRAFRLHTAFRLQGFGSLVCEVSRARICRPAHESALSMRDSNVAVIVRCHLCVCLFASKTTWKAYAQAHGWQLHSSRDMPVHCSCRCLAMLPRSQLFTRQSRRRTMDFPQNSFEYWDVLQAPAHQPHLGWAIVELSGGLPTCYMHGVVRSQVSIKGGLIESSQRLLWLLTCTSLHLNENSQIHCCRNSEHRPAFLQSAPQDNALSAFGSFRRGGSQDPVIL